MKRRAFLEGGVAAAWGAPLLTALRQERLDAAAEVLALATRSGQVAAAVMHVTQGDIAFTRSFGEAANEHAMFLLG